jgi:hypothetical protein
MNRMAWVRVRHGEPRRRATQPPPSSGPPRWIRTTGSQRREEPAPAEEPKRIRPPRRPVALDDVEDRETWMQQSFDVAPTAREQWRGDRQASDRSAEHEWMRRVHRQRGTGFS